MERPQAEWSVPASCDVFGAKNMTILDQVGSLLFRREEKHAVQRSLFFKDVFIYILCVCMFCWQACLCIMCTPTPSACRGTMTHLPGNSSEQGSCPQPSAGVRSRLSPELWKCLGRLPFQVSHDNLFLTDKYCGFQTIELSIG